jgi:GLPGLI family protein
MKYIIVSFIFLFATIDCLGQSSKYFRVTYEYSNQFESNNEVLIADQTNAVYIKGGMAAKIPEGELEYKNGTYVAPLLVNSTSEVQFFSNNKSNDIVMNTISNDKVRYIVRDSTITFNWKLSKDETKKIGGYLCKKANLDWRGRKYTAYYTEEIPLLTGPYKFKGLPGMILEISTGNSSSFHSWVAKKIQYPIIYLKNEVPSLTDNSYQKINLKQFINIKQRLKEEKYKAHRARLGKDVEITKIVSSRLGPELFYEWEKNKNGTSTF